MTRGLALVPFTYHVDGSSVRKIKNGICRCFSEAEHGQQDEPWGKWVPRAIGVSIYCVLAVINVAAA